MLEFFSTLRNTFDCLSCLLDIKDQLAFRKVVNIKTSFRVMMTTYNLSFEILTSF